MRFAEALFGGLVAGFVLLALLPIVLGWRPYTVLTGSMRPGIQPGDVVMDQPVRIADAQVGDVVTFSDPGRGGALVTHRIRSITRGPVQTDVETRGDANTSSERWTIKTQDQVGRVVYVIPKVGHVANAIRNPIGILLLVVIPVLGIGFGIVRKIWQDEDDDEDPGAGGAPPLDDRASEPDARQPADSQVEGADIARDR
ncbi:MAG: signal peptidase I [Solirubrobacteraceae bacterium]|nr:signal peptidase I [Solirubrobacteraceae bacterium]